MDSDDNRELREIFRKLENIHYPAGPTYTKTQKAKALLSLKENELEAIYSLTECHAPALRFIATNRYEKTLDSSENTLPLNKNNFNYECNTNSIENRIQTMLNRIAEMPKEWTIVQLTSQYNAQESVEVNPNKLYVNPLHLTVFNCGQNVLYPYTVVTDIPKDKINGSTIEIRQEMHSILEEFSSFYKSITGIEKFKLMSEKQSYKSKMFSLNYRLEDLVKQIQNNWLCEWRCLCIGKFVDQQIEDDIQSNINNVLKSHNCTDINPKMKQLLTAVTKGAGIIKQPEIKKALKHIFPEEHHKNLRLDLIKLIQTMYSENNFSSQKRHPVILIVDEKLDFLSWEMIDVLQDQPVSRMPSLHFTYALFKEHENSIVNGLKTINNRKSGKYIINPGANLKSMEVRLMSFLNYWCPDWSGFTGSPPSESHFRDMVKDSDIFIYSGHGNGTQFISAEQIQRMRVNAVVLLFGCSSVSLKLFGPQVEMYVSYQMFLIACSPCIVGMLWTVGDLATDRLTTDFLSSWLPSEASIHWKFVDRKWETDGSLKFAKKKPSKDDLVQHEPELLRALCKTKKNSKQYWIAAACVVRGLPVKLQSC